MVQNSKPKSASSASPRKRGKLERAHTRSPRAVKPTTPRVLSNYPRPQGITVAQQRERNRRAGVGSASSTGSTRRRNASAQGKDSSGARRTSQDKSRNGSARQQAKAKRKGGIGTKLIIAAVLLVALVAGYIALYNSSFLTITDVQARGNSALRSGQIVEMAAVPEDSTFLRVDTDTISNNLLANPWIQSADVSRVFPTTLVLNVKERAIAAVVDIVPEKATDKTTHWLISADGTWIANLDDSEDSAVTLNAEQLSKIVKFKDVSPAAKPEAGTKTTDAGIINALAILDGFSPDMRAMVASISAPDKVKASLLLHNNVGVAFGAAEDIPAKEDAIATLLEAHQGTITYINVRVANRATYRATE